MSEKTAAPEPEFDPATWTPDKPWPKGYYKPMSLLDRLDGVYVPGKGVLTSAEADALGRNSRYQGGYRAFFWFIVALVPPLFGLAAMRAASASRWGFLHMVGSHVPAWLLLPLCGLVAPTLLYAVIMQDEGTGFRRNLLIGLAKTLLLLAIIAVVLFGRPLLRWAFDWLVYQINLDAAMRQP